MTAPTKDGTNGPSEQGQAHTRPGTGSSSSHRRQIYLVARREMSAVLMSRGFLAASALTLTLIIVAFAIQGLFPSDPLRLGLVGEQPEGAVESLALVADLEPDEIETIIVSPSADPGSVLEAESLDAIIVEGREIILAEEDGSTVGFVNAAWSGARLTAELEQAGADSETLIDALSPLVVTELNPDTDRGSRETSAFVTVLILFIGLQLTGAFIMMGVMEEKGTRIVELLLSSIHPRNLLVGKVVGVSIVGILQLVTLVAGVVIGALATGNDLPGLRPSTLVVGLVFFCVGLLFYGSLFAAGASLAPSQQDAQATLAPVSLLIMLSYIGSIVAATAPDSTMARGISLVPSVSPFAMPARVASGDATGIEVGAALVLALVVTGLVFSLGARIYTRSVIHTDRKLGWREAFSLTS